MVTSNQQVVRACQSNRLLLLSLIMQVLAEHLPRTPALQVSKCSYLQATGLRQKLQLQSDTGLHHHLEALRLKGICTSRV
jgi:hypothetical protein